MDGVIEVFRSINFSTLSLNDAVSFIGAVFGGAVGVRIWGAKLMPCKGKCGMMKHDNLSGVASLDN